MSDGQDQALRSRAEEFLRLLQRLIELLSPAQVSKTFEFLADAYDLSTAKDDIEWFTKSGNPKHFQAAERRLHALVERVNAKNRGEAKKVLLRLTVVAKDLTESDMRVIVKSREHESPDSDTTIASPDPKDVLVIAAMYEPELSAFVERIGPVENFVGTRASGLPDITYFLGSISRSAVGKNSEPISVACLFLNRTGLTDCASLVASGIGVFEPRLVALTGVCAGRSAMKVKKNDIVVPASSFTYDSGKYTDSGFEREPHWTDASVGVVQRVRTVGRTVIDAAMTRINASSPNKVRRPNIHFDVMACGSSVVDREGMIDQIAGANRKVVGLDMESYAFLRSAALTDPGVARIVVKGVMDLSTGKSDSVKAQAAFWAAAFLTGLLAIDFDLLVASANRPDLD